MGLARQLAKTGISKILKTGSSVQIKPVSIRDEAGASAAAEYIGVELIILIRISAVINNINILFRFCGNRLTCV